MRPENGSNFVGEVEKLRNSFQDIKHSRTCRWTEQTGLPGSTILRQQVIWDESRKGRSKL